MRETIKFLKPFDVSKINIDEHPDFSGVYIVELPLDSVPDENWREAFEQKWRSSRDLWDRKICLIDNKVRLLSTADHYTEKLDWIERLVNDTNKMVKEYDRVIEKQSELIKDETAKQLLQIDANKASILDAIRRKLT